MINPVAKSVLSKRYLHPGEKNEKHMFKRVAEAIVAPVKNNEEKKRLYDAFYHDMVEGEIMPNSPALMNLGTSNQMASACFVIPIEDSMHGIFQSMHDAAIVHKYGGGTGFCFSTLRPANSLVKTTNGSASGPLSFLKVYDKATNVVKQAGKRRGANMGTFMIDHPDVLDFIVVKDKEGDISNFNLSVMLTDKFMKAVAEDKDWSLKWNQKIASTHKAVDIFNMIVKQSWKNGEPGILFIDTINNEAVPEGFKKERMNASNPCFAGSCKLRIRSGDKAFKNLSGKNVSVESPVTGKYVLGKVFKSGKKPTVRLRFNNRNVLDLTRDHVLKGIRGNRIMASNSIGKQIKIWSDMPNIHNPYWVQLGFIQGDGTLSQIDKNGHKNIEINIGKKDNDIRRLFNIPHTGKRKHTIYGFVPKLINYGFYFNKLPNRPLPNKVSKIHRASFLRGLFSANGCVIKDSRVAIKSTCKKMILQVKDLLGKFGINHAYVTTNKSKMIRFSNGEYLVKESYDLNIGRINEVAIFYNKIGFEHKYKTKSLLNLLIKRAPKVVSIKDLGVQDVYDFSMGYDHWGFVNGFVAHNCGEQILEPYGSCNLAAINLGLMIKEDDKDEFVFDYKRFEEKIYTIVKMLDMLIDITDYPIPQISKKSLETRRIGAGIMGFADLLIKLRIRYGSHECLKLVNDIMSFYKKKADEKSRELGKKGNRKHKAIMTIAPTGTTSMFCNASAGIEPYYNYWYYRNINDEKIFVFEGIIDKYLNEDQKQYIQGCIDNNTEIDESKIRLPEHFVTSDKVSWKEHIDVQAAFQKYIDNSISKTINMPNSATEEDVARAITYAWETKCKGVTVYRDGSREEQVLTKERTKKLDTKEEYIVKGEITLPDEMDAKTYRIKASLGKGESDQSFYVHIGLIKEKPVQLFIDYKRQSDNASEANQLKAQMIESLGMSISYQLRYSVPLTVIIKQLQKIPFSWMMSLHVQISNILSRYLNVDTNTCSECGGKITFTEGCKKCPCGHVNGCDH